MQSYWTYEESNGSLANLEEATRGDLIDFIESWIHEEDEHIDIDYTLVRLDEDAYGDYNPAHKETFNLRKGRPCGYEPYDLIHEEVF